MTERSVTQASLGKLVLAFTMSLDGFIAGPDISVDQPMGRGGERLHDWMFKSTSDVDAEMARELSARPGAVVLGRRTFELGIGPWADTPFPVPCFVLTHEAREPLAMKSGTFTFVTDGIQSAFRQAKAAANNKDALVMGADAAQQYLKAGLVDEIVLQLAPVLMGAGTRLFDHIGDEAIELATERVIASPFATHMRFRARATEAGSTHSPQQAR